jgi:hypothetical protein
MATQIERTRKQQEELEEKRIALFIKQEEEKFKLREL